MTRNNFPAPDCEAGYSWFYIEEILPEEEFIAFRHWMRGQTCVICDGRRFNHETRQYEATDCANNPHGGVVYRWDFERYFGLHGVAAKEIWD